MIIELNQRVRPFHCNAYSYFFQFNIVFMFKYMFKHIIINSKSIFLNSTSYNFFIHHMRKMEI